MARIREKTQLVSALEMIGNMESPMYGWLKDECDKGADPNSLKLYRIVMREWPEMLKYVERQTEHIKYHRQLFEKEMKLREEQYNDGLISVTEYGNSVAWANQQLQEALEGFILY